MAISINEGLHKFLSSPEIQTLIQKQDFEGVYYEYNNGYSLYTNKRDTGKITEFLFACEVNPFLNMTVIPDMAFSHMGLTSYSVPKNITKLCEQCFGHCTQLKTIDLGTTITSIDEGAFQNCKSLSSIIIPDSVTNMEEGVFWGCSSLTQVLLSKNCISIPRDTFHDCKSLANLAIPEGVKYLDSQTFCNCNCLHTLMIPKTMKTFCEEAFYNCGGWRDIHLYYSGTSQEWDKIQMYNAFVGISRLIVHCTDKDIIIE